MAAVNSESAQKAIDIIEGIVAVAEVGKVYTGKVTRLMNFGAFVEILPGKEGLVHISNMVDDYYIYDDEKKELFGQGSRKVFKIGNSVKIRVDKVSIAKAEIDFALI